MTRKFLLSEMRNKMDLHSLVAQIHNAYTSGSSMIFYVAAGISNDCPTHLLLGLRIRMSTVENFGLEVGANPYHVGNKRFRKIKGVILRGQRCYIVKSLDSNVNGIN